VTGPDERALEGRRATGHVDPRQAELYLRQALAPEELLAVDDHLAICPFCRGALLERRSLEPALAAWRRVLAEDRDDPQLADEGSHPAVSPPPRSTGGSRIARARLSAAAVAILVCLGAAKWLRDGAASSPHPTAEAPPDSRANPVVPGSEAPWSKPVGDGRRQGGGDDSASVAARDDIRVRLLDHGRWIELTASGTVAGLQGLAADRRARVADGLRKGELPVPERVRELGGYPSVLRGTGPPDDFAVLGPVATAVRSARPTFRWLPHEGAESYHVLVFDRAYARVAESPALTRSEWTPPAPLPRGEVLSWQVRARLGKGSVAAPRPPAPEARFLILTAAEDAQLEAALAAGEPSHLAHAVSFAAAGLLPEAQDELGALMEANPSSPVVRSLLASLRAGAP
jgi:hypothetical protein